MNAVNEHEIEAAVMLGPNGSLHALALNRARIYHFFELALAHPGEDGFDYFSREATERELLEACAGLPESDEALREKGMMSARSFFTMLRSRSYENAEAAHISLFSANYPHLPCPPYGSLYTAADSGKRLEEMLAIKSFYQKNGVDIADSFNDLPDHLCVELEFSMLLCFREAEALSVGDAGVLGGVRSVQKDFLDRFLLPLGNNLADLAVSSSPDNPYSALVETMRCFLLQHRRELDATAESSSQDQESQS